MASTIKQSEINQFRKDSQSWWDENGAFAPLHALNPVRMQFIRDVLNTTLNLPLQGEEKNTPFKNLTHLDIGCGGGLVCEPFARLGARVTGIDADAQGVKVAQDHARASGLDIIYHATSIEEFRKKNKSLQFDIITALEIIEHVDAPELFLTEAAACLKPGGVFFVSTLNRTAKSFALGIVAAEYILGWVPKGTHNWRQFMRPSTLTRGLRALGLEPVAASGITYHALTREFALDPHDLSVNYVMGFRKISTK